ncbi:MAG: helix-turn-helix domain-containing protein [Planctomycetes bacterium]|nr:helix-turn-helix domain-containing protein [Planctomycetota bacterium]
MDTHSSTATGTTPSPLALSLAEAADALGVSARTVWSLANGHKIPTLRVGRRLLIPRLALEKWIAARTEAATRE